MDHEKRADELVASLGALTRMVDQAMTCGEIALAARLTAAAEEAQANLSALDPQLAAGWQDVYLWDERDRGEAAAELRAMAVLRLFTPPAKSLLGRAATMIDRDLAP